ncbi:hypothetical protein BH11MYX3_BH11MYX3_44980 [soil metagenome]
MSGDDPASVEARLRAALTTEVDESREGVDMSAEAITNRVREVAELSALCLELVAVGARQNAQE